MTTCPACSNPTRRRSNIHTCLTCMRRWDADGNELHFPVCVMCGGETRPAGRAHNGKQRYICNACNFQSPMDDSSRAVRMRAREKCATCGKPLIKHGNYRGKQMWYCKTCNRQSPDMAEKATVSACAPTGHSFFEGYVVIGFEPPEYCNGKVPCSRCRHLLRCGNGDHWLPCEGLVFVETKERMMAL